MQEEVEQLRAEVTRLQQSMSSLDDLLVYCDRSGERLTVAAVIAAMNGKGYKDKKEAT